MFAELLGRSAGYCKGRSGSMHIADTSTGNLGANAIVGGGIPLALGAALASQVQAADWVAVSFFGDGAVGEGIVHECLNIAALWRLPIVFVCENNHYAELSTTATVLAAEPIARVADSFRIASATVDGNDVGAVAEAARSAVALARSSAGPTFLEAVTYRQSGHFEGDPTAYRPAGELDDWMSRDPIAVERDRLQSLGVGAELLDDMKRDAEAEMEAAIDWAEQQVVAPTESLFEDVYA
jgi:TPP-dependent pyruvate/acetoin dehydrogenase alpha subunit